MWPGRAGPRPSGRAPGHCLSAGVPFGWPSPAHFSQALATTSPRVLSPRTGSSRGWVSVGTQSSAPAPRPSCAQARMGRAHPDALMGPLGRLATFASWRLKPAASADLPGPAGSLLWGLGRWGGQPPGAGMGSWSGCPRRAWLRLLSPDRGILAGGWRGLQPKPGPEEPQEAGGLVPDLAGGGADREGCV